MIIVDTILCLFVASSISFAFGRAVKLKGGVDSQITLGHLIGFSFGTIGYLLFYIINELPNMIAVAIKATS